MASALFGAVLVTGVTACSTSPDDNGPQVAYEDAQTGESLVVPPDLRQPEREGGTSVPPKSAVGGGGGGGATGPGTGDAAAGERTARAANVLPRFNGIRLVRSQETAWIEVADTPPERIWPQLDDFLRSQGFEVATKRPELGIIETAWFDRQDMPRSGGLSGFLSGLFGGGPESVRDKYQIRLERADGGTRIFVEQRSLAEVAKAKDPKRSQGYRWEPRGGQPALENEMRQRLLVYLGVDQQRAAGIISNAAAQRTLGATPVLVRTDSGAYSIRVDDDNLPRTFARVGDALARIDATVTSKSRERDQARYAIEWASDGGESKALQVRLRRRQGGIRIVAADRSGEARSGAIHQALLRQLTTAMGGDAQAVAPSASGANQEEEADNESADDDSPFERPRF